MLCGAEAEDRRRHWYYRSYPKDTDNLEQLIINVDDAMYQVKKNGKNDFAFYKTEGRNNEQYANKTNEIKYRKDKGSQAEIL